MAENLKFDASVDISKFEANIKAMEAQIRHLENTTKGAGGDATKSIDNIGQQSQKTGNILSSIAKTAAFTAIAAGAKQLISEVIAVRQEFEKYKAVLTNTLGSEQLAASAMADLTKFASKTPFALQELTGAYVKLTNYGLQPSMEAMTAYGDLASSVGKGFDQLAEAMADAVTGEFERLKEFGVKARKEGDQVTFTFKGQTTVVKNNAQAIEEYIKSLGKMEGVAGSMAAISDTLGGKISNLGDAWDSFLNALGGETSGVFTTVIGLLTDFVNSITMAVKSTKAIKEEVMNRNTSENIQEAKEEIKVMAARLVSGGMDEKEASKRATELYKQQMKQQVEDLEKAYNDVVAEVDAKGKMFVYGKAYKKSKAQIEEAKGRYELVKRELEAFEATEKNEEKKTDKTAGIIPTKGTIEALEEQLKELKKRVGTFTDPEAEAANAKKIIEKTGEIEEAWRRVRVERDKSLGFTTTDQTGKNTKLTSKTVTGIQATGATGFSQALAPMKQLTAEEIKQLNIRKQQVDAENKISDQQEVQKDNLEELSGALDDASGLMGSLSGLAGNFNEGLGDALGTMSNIVGEAGQLAEQLASGDYIGAIMSGIGLISEVVNAAKEAEKASIESAQRYNQLLLERIDILVDAGMITDDEAMLAKRTALLEKQRLAWEALMSTEVGAQQGFWDLFPTTVDFSEMLDAVYGVGNWTSETINEITMTEERFADFQKEYAQTLGGWTSFWAALPEEASQAFNAWLEATNAINTLMEENKEMLIGFSESDLTKSIVDGITNGFKLAEDGLGDFADSFKALLQSAATQAMMAVFETRFLAGLMDQFYEAMESDDGNGIKLTEEERAALKESYRIAVEQMQDYYKQWSSLFEDAAEESEKATGISGEAKQITEKTATAIEGNMNAMLFNIIDTKKIIDQQLITLQEIRNNTAHNYHLIGIDENIELLRKGQLATNETLSKIAAGGGPVNYGL